MTRLAMFGGSRVLSEPPGGVSWPVVTAADEQAVLAVLRRGVFADGAEGEPEVGALEDAWAATVGVAHCAGVASGTAALHLALAALDVGPGDDVVVPAVSMNATALAVLSVGAQPVFADIDPVTFTLDPASLASVITPRTAAVVPVHLHGLPADMAALRAQTDHRGIPLVEDAAQAHGAGYRGVRAGALGTLGCFSLHPSKNLPTCGEGGLITTDDPHLHERVSSLRRFGERQGAIRDYVSHVPGGNHKLSPVQAAFARSQLSRFAEYQKARERNVTGFLDRLRDLPGLVVPVCPADREHAWHILRFRLDPPALGAEDIRPSALRQVLHRALRAEGVPMSRYQVVPLPAQPSFRTESAGRFPVASAVLADSLCLQRRHLNPDSGDALARYADAFAKVWEELPRLCRIATSLPAEAAA
ncbi:MAG TPA: DegT/DnrJ/EryC1/StrS family aminotransferase [Pseudonocardiaceae bacterium]